MANAPVIQYLQLDADYDPSFDTLTVLSDLDAVSQAILTRLKLFLGEWWENLSIGLPVFQLMLGQLGTAQGLAAMELAIQQNIAGGPYVNEVLAVTATFENGQLSVTYAARTDFGIVNSSTSAPALATAGLET
jgi:hypothetical protein